MTWGLRILAVTLAWTLVGASAHCCCIRHISSHTCKSCIPCCKPYLVRHKLLWGRRRHRAAECGQELADQQPEAVAGGGGGQHAGRDPHSAGGSPGQAREAARQPRHHLQRRLVARRGPPQLRQGGPSTSQWGRPSRSALSSLAALAVTFSLTAVTCSGQDSSSSRNTVRHQLDDPVLVGRATACMRGHQQRVDVMAQVEKLEDPVLPVAEIVAKCPPQQLMAQYRIPAFADADEFLQVGFPQSCACVSSTRVTSA